MPDFLEGQQLPPGYQNGGTVTIDAPTQSTGVVVDNAIVPGSTNAVSGGAVAEAIANFISAGGTEDQVVLGDGTKANLNEKVSDILEGMNLGGDGNTDLSDYVTETALNQALGLDITAPINLTAQTATRYTTYTQTIARSVFSLSTGNAAVSLLFAPAGCAVVIGETNVTITWTPISTGENYILFWISNGAVQGRAASLKITVAAGSTVTPVGELVTTSAAISAGKLVNIYDDGGTPKMRLAIATSVSRIAVAFVTDNAASGGELVPKYSGNVNPFFTGLTPGRRYFLSTTEAGGISEFGPAANSGHVWQPVGVAISETELLLDIDEHIIRSAP